MKRLTSILVFLLLVSPAAFGQTGPGAVRGFGCHVSWSPILGATVEAKNAQTRIAYSALSARSGNYAIPNLPPGQYIVTVTSHGMKPYVHAYVLVLSETFVREDVNLEMDTNPILGGGSETPPLTSFVGPSAPRFLRRRRRICPYVTAPDRERQGTGTVQGSEAGKG
jgi:hypothetical protein